MRIAIVGDYHAEYEAHRATDNAFSGLQVEAEWVLTRSITSSQHLAEHDGVLIAPGTPYDMDGALDAIRYGREQSVPMLATCGGFQHANLSRYLSSPPYDTLWLS